MKSLLSKKDFHLTSKVDTLFDITKSRNNCLSLFIVMETAPNILTLILLKTLYLVTEIKIS